MFFNVLDFGARRDGIVDDAPAVQAAFDQAALWGGTVVLPPGFYRWASPVVATFAAGPMGNGGDGRLLCHGATILVETPGDPFVALSVVNAARFTVEGGRFYGTLDEQNPTRQPAPLSGVIHGGDLAVRDCDFNGFILDRPGNTGALESGNAVLKGTALSVERCFFGACGGGGQPIVLAENYVELAVRGCWFPDFYHLHGTMMAPASGNYPAAAIAARAPHPDTGRSQLAGASFVVEDCHLDEGVGGFYGIAIDRTGSGKHIPFVSIRRLTQAVVPYVGSRGVSIYGAGHVTIEDWFVRQGHNGSVALMADHCDSITVARTRTDPLSPVTAVAVSPTVGRVRIADSHLDRSSIKAGQLVDLDS